MEEPSNQPGVSVAAPRSEFNWPIYVDATLAGLSALLPLPYVDSMFEAHFRRRMVRTIAGQRSRALHPAALRYLHESQTVNPVKDALLLPVSLSLGLMKRLSRKLLYALSVKRAVDALTYYWRRAYLLDYMIRQGHLSSDSTAPAAAAALNSVLAQSGSGPFRWLAQQVVAATPHVASLLWLARHHDSRQNDALLLHLRSLLAERWPDLSDYLRMLARRYDEQYANTQAAFGPAHIGGAQMPRLLEQPQEG